MFLPSLLDGFIWYKNNGLRAIEWFTPSFCGGSVVFANPNSAFYSVPQFLTFLVDPLVSVILTIFGFALAGFISFYFLLKKCFSLSRPVSLLGAAFFLFNGFYIHRMMAGHLGYHTFMLIPLVCFMLLRPGSNRSRLRGIFSCMIAGIAIALMAQTVFITLLIPALLSIILVGILHSPTTEDQKYFWNKFLFSIVIGMLLSLGKLTAFLYLMQQFPRNDYVLPGIPTITGAFLFALRVLCFSASVDPARVGLFTNTQWSIEGYELEYGVSLIPVLLIIFGTGKLVYALMAGKATIPLPLKYVPTAIMALLILAIPIAVNFYTPSWNDVLKEIPVIKNSSLLVRWFLLYIPAVIVAAMIFLEKESISGFVRISIVSLSLIFLVFTNFKEDRSHHSEMFYHAGEIVDAYYKIKTGQRNPVIASIGAYSDEQGNLITPIYRNNMMIFGSSQLLCYEPIFGYRLEKLPFKSLRLGPIMNETGDTLNIKNPAFYLWPKENGGTPGDHFTKKQINEATAFAHYKPFQFNMPILQKTALWINGVVLGSCLCFIIFFLVKILKDLFIRRRRNKFLRAF